jgi:hypothetical protein
VCVCDFLLLSCRSRRFVEFYELYELRYACIAGRAFLYSNGLLRWR